jgi:hypothetical protein
MLSLEHDIESVVLAMWGEPEEEITREAMIRFDISYEQAYELVLQAIAEEVTRDEEYFDDEF